MEQRSDRVASPGIAVRTFGEGPPLLFVHGLAASGVSWRPVAERIQGYRSIAPDLLGFGSSVKPDVAYSLATHGDALEGLVRQHQPLAIIGHSMGAIIAMELLRRFPEIGVGVLVSPAAFSSAKEAKDALFAHHGIGSLTVRSRFIGRVSCALMCRLRPALRPVLPWLARDLPSDVVQAGLDHTWKSLSRSLEGVVLSGVSAALFAEVGDRLTIIHGINDETVPIAAVEAFRERCHEFLAVDGGHMLPLRRPEVVAEGIQHRLSHVR